MPLSPRKTRRVTLDIGEHEFDALMRHLDAFRETDAAGRPKWAAAEEARADTHDALLDALAHLLKLAEQGDGTSAEVAARVLAALYNGYDFPLNPAELRPVDDATLDACLAALRLDATERREVHTYFPDGEARCQAFMRRWGLLPELPRTPFAPDVPRYQLALQRVDEAPGYRSATSVAQVFRSNVPDKSAKDVELVFRAADTERLASALVGLHQRAWSAKRPIDAKPDEVRPPWL